MFTLRSLFIHKGCKHVKCLQEDKEYPLEHLLPANFFAPNICITSIVGQNGAGKSSLLDLIFRIINNLGYCLFKRVDKSTNTPICFVVGLNADLCYMVDGVEYVLKCRNRVMALECGDKRIRFAVRVHGGNKKLTDEKIFADYEDYTNKDFPKMKEVAQLFFYTIATNYSLQAYIAQDYKDEPTLSYREGKINNIPAGDIWINNLFHKNDGYLCPIVLNPYRKNGKVDMNNEEHLTIQRLEAILIEDDEINPFLVDYKYDKIRFSFRPRTIQHEFVNPKGERMYLSEEEVAEKNLRTLLEENKYKYQQDKDLEDFNEYSQDCNSFAHAVLKGLGLQAGDMYTVQRAVKEYAVYKVLNIAEKYPSFSQYGECFSTECLFAEPTAERRDFELDLAEKLAKEAKGNESHIGLKLQQVLNFLEHTKNLTGEQWKRLEEPFTYHEYCSLLGIPEKGMALQERMKHLPPSIFKAEIYVHRDNDEKPVPLNQLSSGERQLSYQMSTLVYHLLNICSVPNDETRVKYKNVLLVLDEVEICFHPDYQRKFIKRFLDTIISMGLNKRLNIHLLITTHSPFILSDIPLPNILCLEKGEIKKMKLQGSFAANVYDLLNNPFFMEQFVGDFAVEKLESIIHMVKMADHLSKEQFNQQLYLVNLIGDEFVREKLIEELYEKLDVSDRRIAIDDEINMHQRRVQYLKEELKKEKNRKP